MELNQKEEIYRVYDCQGNTGDYKTANEEGAINAHIRLYPNLPEDPVVENLNCSDLDDQETFINIMRYKWLKGRKEYKELTGVNLYHSDSLKELLEELIDACNYIGRIYWDFKDVAEKFGYIPIGDLQVLFAETLERYKSQDKGCTQDECPV